MVIFRELLVGTDIMHFKSKKFLLLLTPFIAVVIMIFLADIVVNLSTDEYVYGDLSRIPYNKVGVLLGTSKYRSNGDKNLYFYNRIEAAADLFYAGKISYILISGDKQKHYNEPRDIKKALSKYNIPEDRIYSDNFGKRTYDSIVRVDTIFGERSFTVISQEFHNKRAIYIARSNDLNVIGYNAEDVHAFGGFKTLLREKFARVKMFFDIFTNYQSTYGGEKIKISDAK